ncbi:glycerophosphodiester phosphodiesterase [Pedobacter cryophilus]|uniref:Glycerophosphodiester phosphodiesterase n=2 Tax=Pedobacter cryophilus TaxID=2571271 RepID=A0A4U1C6S2_9SPHI|nr:glycerophosphodiester phosphodiesterase [Pedobacter cryophilus]
MASVQILTAQVKTNNSILLSNYTFLESERVIGQISVQQPNTSIKKVSISGADAAFFKSNKKHQLIIKSNKSKKFYNIQLLVTNDQNIQLQQNFTIVKDEFLKNKVIAHRGAWKNLPTAENSIAALQQAIKLGCQGSEFDVHISADSVAFINHDPAFKKVEIEQTSSLVLKELTLSNNEKLPLLDDYLKAGKNQNHTKLILEIKPTKLGLDRVKLIAKSVLESVSENEAQAWVEYISFDYEICKALMAIDPFAKVAYLNGDKSPEQLAADKFYGLDYHYSVFKKNPDWIKNALALGLTVNAWTANDTETIQWLLDSKATFITTNEPELALKMVSK